MVSLMSSLIQNTICLIEHCFFFKPIKDRLISKVVCHREYMTIK